MDGSLLRRSTNSCTNRSDYISHTIISSNDNILFARSLCNELRPWDKICHNLDSCERYETESFVFEYRDRYEEAIYILIQIHTHQDGVTWKGRTVLTNASSIIWCKTKYSCSSSMYRLRYLKPGKETWCLIKKNKRNMFLVIAIAIWSQDL